MKNAAIIAAVVAALVAPGTTLAGTKGMFSSSKTHIVRSPARQGTRGIATVDGSQNGTTQNGTQNDDGTLNGTTQNGAPSGSQNSPPPPPPPPITQNWCTNPGSVTQNCLPAPTQNG